MERRRLGRRAAALRPAAAAAGAGARRAQRPADRRRRHRRARSTATSAAEVSAASGSPDFLPKFQHTSQWEFLNTLSWLKGDHQFKFGIDVLAPMKNEYMDIPATRGSVRYRGRYTGNAVADYLLGYTSDAQLSNVFVADQRHWATSFFAGDDWRLSPKLTLNLGPALRLHHPRARGRQQPAQLRPGRRGSVFAATDGSLEERGLVRPDKNNFAPRIGLVYQVSDTLVLRGGYGIFYNMFDRIGSEDQLALNPPGLINNSVATTSHHGAAVLPARRLPGRTSWTRAQVDYRRIRLRAAAQDASKTTIHQYSVGRAEGDRELLRGDARPRRHAGPQPRQPGEPQPAGGRQRSAALSQLRLHRVARAERHLELQGHGPRLPAPLHQGLGLQPRVHAQRLHRPERRAPLDGRLSELLAETPRDLDGLGRPVRLRHAAPLRRRASSSSCRSRRAAAA